MKSWLFKIEQIFSFDEVPMEKRIGLTIVHLEGEAIQGQQSFLRYRQYTCPSTWNEYVMALVERFSLEFDDPMEEIKNIK